MSFHILFLNFAKLQIPRIVCDGLSFPFIWFCLATIGVCVFGALTSVGALFYFAKNKKCSNIQEGRKNVSVRRKLLESTTFLPSSADKQDEAIQWFQKIPQSTDIDAEFIK